MSVYKYLLVLLLLPALLLPPCAQAEVLYTVTELSNNFTPSDINNVGQIAGWRQADDGRTHVALYSNGTVNDLGSWGSDYAFANAINDAGTMTGIRLIGADWHGFIYDNGVVTDLGAGTDGRAINASGDVVGGKFDDTGSGAFLYHAGTLTELPHLGQGTVGIAWDINDAGDIVGESSLAAGPDAPHHPFLYRNGELSDLGSAPDLARKSGDAINNAGRIAGTTGDWNGVGRAFVYDNGVSTALGNFGGTFITIGGLNNAGTIVGTAQGPQNQGIAFIYLDGMLVDLNTLIDPALGWNLSRAADINDLGQIVVWGDRGGDASALRLDLAGAIPEPGLMCLLVPGLLLLLAARYRTGVRMRPPRLPSQLLFTAR